MKEEKMNGKTYKLPGSLSKFQKQMDVHLIDYKWKHIAEKVGLYKYRGEYIEYDAILPKSEQSKFPLIYPSILSDLK